MVETRNICASLREAKSQYTRAGRDRMIENRDFIHWPSLSRRGVRSPGGVRHWARCTTIFREFTRSDTPIPRQVLVPDIVRVRDLYLRARRHTGEDKMSLRKLSAEDEETLDLSVPIRVEAPESSTAHTSLLLLPRKPKVLLLPHLLLGWSRKLLPYLLSILCM